jgi:YVTN family beta-propeller protein
MKTSGMIILSVAVAIGVGGLVASLNLSPTKRQSLRIYLHDQKQRFGLKPSQRDLEHMVKMTGLNDLSNVSCRHCHGIELAQMPWNKPRQRHPTPEGMVLSPDGAALYVALADLDQVVEIDTATRTIQRRASVPGKPIGTAMAPAGDRLFVSCRDADTVVAIDIARLEIIGTAPVGIGPVGVGFAQTPNGDRLIVANTGSDDVSMIDVASMTELTRVKTGREPYGVRTSADGQQAFVASRLAEMAHADMAPAAELTVIDIVRTRAIKRVPLESAHLSECIALDPHRGWILTPMVRVRNLIPITQVARGWVMSSGIAFSRLDETETVQMPLDEANAYFADPADLVVHPRGHRAYVASGGGDVVTVIDLDRIFEWLEHATLDARRRAIHNLELAHDYVVARIPTRRNPTRLALSPDGNTLYVAERLENSILLIDTRSNEALDRIQLGDGGSDDPVRRGERIFTTAAKTFQSQFSCRSCHPDGHVDGLTYDFDGDGIGDNMLDNRSLQGLAGTWPFKWNGQNPSLAVQCGPRFAKVLMRTDPFTDDELSDLVAFIESMPPARARSAHLTELTPAERRGRDIFFATHTPGGEEIPRERQCHHCHAPPLYTSRMKTDVGTRGPTTLIDEFDTPHLLGIGASAPYLHDGRARTLEELWTIYQTNDLHGVSSYMNKHQLNDLVDFLKSL